MANVQVFQRHAHLAGAVKLEFVNGREGKIAKGVLTAISNTRRAGKSSGDAASRPMCQLVWRSGCSAAGRTVTRSGGSATDVPPSAATGAAVEPLRALQCTLTSAARLRAWRVTGVAI